MGCMPALMQDCCICRPVHDWGPGRELGRLAWVQGYCTGRPVHGHQSETGQHSSGAQSQAAQPECRQCTWLCHNRAHRQPVRGAKAGAPPSPAQDLNRASALQHLAGASGPGATAVAAAYLCGAVDRLLLHVLACIAVRGRLESYVQADVNRNDEPIWGHAGYAPATRLRMRCWPISAVRHFAAHVAVGKRTQCSCDAFQLSWLQRQGPWVPDTAQIVASRCTQLPELCHEVQKQQA